MQGTPQLGVKFHMQYNNSLVYLDIQLKEVFLYYSWIWILGITLQDYS